MESYWYIIIIAALLILLGLVIAWYASLKKKQKSMPSHVQLYFDENFRKIMTEWDMTTRDRVKDFKKDMSGRLAKVGSSIDDLEANTKKLDKRLNTLDREMSKMEKF
jgi:uncharacterized protein HemX